MCKLIIHKVIRFSSLMFECEWLFIISFYIWFRLNYFLGLRIFKETVNIFISGIEHFLLQGFWFRLNMLTDWYMSFCCFLIEIAHAMWTFYVWIKRASCNYRLCILNTFAWYCNITTFVTIRIIILDVLFRHCLAIQLFFITFIRLIIHKWMSSTSRIPLDLRLIIREIMHFIWLLFFSGWKWPVLKCNSFLRVLCLLKVLIVLR